jgi:hypothetical protein
VRERFGLLGTTTATRSAAYSYGRTVYMLSHDPNLKWKLAALWKCGGKRSIDYPVSYFECFLIVGSCTRAEHMILSFGELSGFLSLAYREISDQHSSQSRISFSRFNYVEKIVTKNLIIDNDVEIESVEKK